jgi:hypothetical protein
VDSAGNAYVTGETASADFPAINGYQTSNGGSSDAFVTELDPSGAVVLYSTFFGGAALDRGTGIALDPAGKVLVTGETSSDDFPQLEAFQTTRAGGRDAFLAQFDTSQAGTASLLYSSYLGGSADDVAFGVAADSSGNAWVVGETASADFPVMNAPYPTYQGGPSDTFISEIASPSAPLAFSPRRKAGNARALDNLLAEMAARFRLVLFRRPLTLIRQSDLH